MNAKLRTIEIDEVTAALLEARAAARNLTLAQLLADLAANDAALPADLAEDERRLRAFREDQSGIDWSEARDWLESWGRANEMPAPKARKP